MKIVVLKSDLDRRTAYALGLTPSEVSEVTSTFIQEIMQSLIQGRRVQLQKFGELCVINRARKPRTMRFRTGTFKKGQRGRIVELTIKRNYVVSFRKLITFKKALNAHYGEPTEKVEHGQSKGGEHGKVRRGRVRERARETGGQGLPTLRG